MLYLAAHVELKGFCSHGGGVLLPEPGILRVQGCQPAASRKTQEHHDAPEHRETRYEMHCGCRLRGSRVVASDVRVDLEVLVSKFCFGAQMRA